MNYLMILSKFNNATYKNLENKDDLSILKELKSDFKLTEPNASAIVNQLLMTTEFKNFLYDSIIFFNSESKNNIKYLITVDSNTNLPEATRVASVTDMELASYLKIFDKVIIGKELKNVIVRFESKFAPKYDAGTGEIGNYKKPCLMAYKGYDLYKKISKGDFTLANDILERTVCNELLKNKNNTVRINYSPDTNWAGNKKIYRIEILD